MSAAAQIQEMISNAVDAVTGRYEDRIKDLENRVAALEAPSTVRTTTAPRRTAKARPAEGTGEARSAGTGI